MNPGKRGMIIKWFDDKGYGFIEPAGGGPHLFFHVRSIINSGRRDLLGQRVHYTEVAGRDGRPAAENVALTTGDETPRQRTYGRRGRRFRTVALFAWAASLGFLGAVGGGFMAGYLPVYPVIVYAFMSIITFSAYANDKAKAGTGLWRTPESTLHWLELLGGWPGALAAQWHIGHKNRKVSYQVVFWLIVILHVGGLFFVMEQGKRYEITGIKKPWGIAPAAKENRPQDIEFEWSER